MQELTSRELLHAMHDEGNERYNRANRVSRGSSPVVVVVYALDPTTLLSPRLVKMMMMLMIDGAALKFDELGGGEMCCVSVCAWG